MTHEATFLGTTMTLALLVGCNPGPSGHSDPAADTPRPDPSPSTAEVTQGEDQKQDEEGAAYGPARVLVDPGAESPRPVAHAVAVMQPTEGNDAHGTVRLSVEGEESLKVVVDMEDLPPGKHATHFHLFGDCSADDGKSAGTHFNLKGSSTAVPDDVERITGNITELDVGEDGRADATFTLEGASLDGRFGVLGRSVVVHAKGNDPDSPPMGAAGARLACGAIGLAQSTLPGT